MSFNDINVKAVYLSPDDDPVTEFFVPVLSQAVSYDRGTAYFSSEAVYEMTVGIKGLINNNGKMRYIISPENLSQEDIDAIHLGYKKREELLNSVNEYLDSSKPYFEKERLSLIAFLIEKSYLDIKVAIPKNVENPGIYHYKLGIFTDKVGNKIAFNGSFNETASAIHSNDEIFTTSSTINGDFEVINTYSNIFNKMWNNEAEYVEVFDFPENLKKKIHTYYKENVNWNLDRDEFKKKKHDIPIVPEEIKEKIYSYQKEAVSNWANNNYRGIFDMATGSGKTWTALLGITELLKKGPLAIIICCPYQHLVDQWSEDLDFWGFTYYAGFTGSRTKQWKKKLDEEIASFNRGVSKYLCFITTNASFATKYVQGEIEKINGKKLLVVDEAHNFGTKRLLAMLTDQYEYRLALSATIDRYNDAAGTTGLYKFFEKKCFSYPLERAIQENKLTRYYYYPVVVYLSPYELEQYDDLTRKIRREIRIDKENHKRYFSKKGEMLLIKRARLVAGAESKIPKLKELLSTRTESIHNLIYCGATTVNDFDYSEGNATFEEKRQVDVVTKMLNDDLHMKVSKFTSEENAEERRNIIKSFDDGTMCQALVAIKCLDEGVSIKSIETAYILASSTNPREYIQRRGRVLRKYKSKDFAYIYDFVTLPRDPATVDDNTDISDDLSLIKRELIRVEDFASLAENPKDSDELINALEVAYGIYNLTEKNLEENNELE